ncbi:hypothetical protein [Chondromyces apiculatus]|uniref:Uncharacterized protein n=1 Tax=Chondromyces apiculatus DSM 436 TaxID=1192034 RepID=A0A017T8I4_9BACT|nr:hypothetical protein [Chondromyces apiculatus]EYF05543.1 Hypothetical protein CAP_3091 [Chondromyces apiculatus DSM 436]
MKIKGSALIHTRNYLNKSWGSELTTALMAKLPPSSREIFGSDRLTSFGWYPVSVWNAVVDEAARWPGKSGAGIVRDIAQYVSQQDLTLAHKVLLKLGTPALVMRQGSVFWSTYFNGGDLIAHQISDRRFRMVLHLGTDPANDPGRLTCREAVTGWQENAIRLSGGYGGQSIHVKCRFERHPVCEYDVSWSR